MGAVKQLLSEYGLAYVDVDASSPHLIVAKERDAIVGAIGIEVSGSAGLMRSLVVHARYRKQGLAKALCSELFDYARGQGVNELFLLTVDASAFFQRLGFAKIERQRVPEAIRATGEFQKLCPETAEVLTKKI